MNCQFEKINDRYKCKVCGYEIISDTDRIFRKCKSRGLGDTIAKITEFLHIPKCGGCVNRQEILNQLIPFSIPKDDINTSGNYVQSNNQ